MKRLSILFTLVGLIGFTALAQFPNNHPRSSAAAGLNQGKKFPFKPMTLREDTFVWQNVASCDSIVTLYGYADATNHDFGWLTGHNYLLDSAKAENFQGITGDKILGVYLWFGTATSTASTQKIHVKIWDDNGVGGSPGTELASVDVTQQSIVTDVANGDLTLALFATPVNLPAGGNFFAGWTQDYKKKQGVMTYDSTRSVGLLTSVISLDGVNLTECADDSIENTAWEQWHYSASDPVNYDGKWHPYYEAYGFSMRNQIWPIVTAPSGCTATISPSSATICKGNTVALTASGGTSYTWAPSTGLDVTTGATVNAKPTVNTTYTVTANGGACTATTTITVNKKPVAKFTQGACTNHTILLTRTGTPTSGVTFKWYKNGVAISGATNSTYTATTTGDYKIKVTITATGCAKTSPVQTVTINCKMAEDRAAQFTADAYPNPFTKSVSVNIASPSKDAAKVQLMDFSGRTLSTFNDVDVTLPFEINQDLTPGVYFIKVVQGTNEKMIKVVKSE